MSEFVVITGLSGAGRSQAADDLEDLGWFVIDNLPATDTGGYSGLADGVDLHTWQLLKGIGLATVLGVGSSLASSRVRWQR